MHLPLIVLFFLALGCLAPGVAEATFPGTNGRIAFSGLGVFSINPDGSGQGKLADGGAPAWSPDGTKIAFAGQGIRVINADGTGEIQLTSQIRDTEPAWSPDGKQLAYTREAGSAFEIAVMNADGTGVRTVTGGLVGDPAPDWSPDGTRIAFARTTIKQTGGLYSTAITDIYVVGADGSGMVQLTNNSAGGLTFGGDTAPSWSPDGRHLVVSNTSGMNSGLDILNSDGSGRTHVSGGSGVADRNAVWSPDGHRIAFERLQSGGMQISTMSADGTDIHHLTQAGFYSGPDWGTSQIAPKPLTLAVSGPRSQRFDQRNQLHLFGKCNKNCFVSASASARVGGKRVRNDTKTRKRASTQLMAGKKVIIYMKFLRNPARLIRKALKRGKTVVVKVKLKAVEPGVPKTVTATRTIRMRIP